MKILHAVESYYPSIGGMQEVVKQLSERMAAQGHDVSVATSTHSSRNFTEKNGVKILSFNISGNMVRGIDGERSKYEALLVENDFDVIVFFAAQQWATDIALPLLKKIKAKKINVPTGYSGFYLPEYQVYYENMKSWIHDFDMNVYLSEDYRDINFARACSVHKTTLIPNGAALDEFEAQSNIHVKEELNIPPDNFLILHVGSYTGIKGHEEAIKIFLGSALKNATLLMIGNNHQVFEKRRGLNFVFKKLKGKLLQNKKIVFDSFSRHFTVAAYKQADIFLFPSNVECSPIVLFECCAAGLPFLSTDCGNAAEIVKWTGGGEILKSEKSGDGFVKAVIEDSIGQLNRLYKNSDARTKMSERGKKAWREKYTWEKITSDYINLYRQLTAEK
jgi:glycosyltransferase involved in cell wall biosynthesis